MSILKGELFPTGTLLGGSAPHVSLLGTLHAEMVRGKDGGLLDLHSGFWQYVEAWVRDEPLLVIGGSLCALLSLPLLLSKTQHSLGVLAVATLSLWAFLARGGQTIGFYLVPLLPLLALNVGLVLGFVFDRLKSWRTNSIGRSVARTIKMVVVGLCLIGTLLGYTSSGLGFKNNPFLLWNGSQADAQQQAVTWTQAHLPLNSRIIIDQYMWLDLHDGYPNYYAFAHYYWKVQEDPAIRDTVFHNDWHNIDYVITTPQMLTDAQQNHMTLVEEAIVHSTVIAHFDTGGWSVDIRRVNNEKGQSLPGQTFTMGSSEMVLPQQALAYMEEQR